MLENLFEPPIIGPFVEPNRRGKEDGRPDHLSLGRGMISTTRRRASTKPS
jgi:hypothetical protein